MGVVPAEFRGLARKMRSDLLAPDLEFDQAFKRLAAPIKARLKRKPHLRREMLIDVVREWHKLPSAQYRLRPVEVRHADQDELEIVERRVAVGRVAHPEWASDDLGVLIIEFGLRVAEGRFTKILRSSTAVSGHALGRRFERARARIVRLMRCWRTLASLSAAPTTSWAGLASILWPTITASLERCEMCGHGGGSTEWAPPRVGFGSGFSLATKGTSLP